ncbi:MAG: carbohydrate porin [Shewanella sp.]|uniref:carbohydrate porin n=1 Tax=Shewanella sp. SNU WT4 TaxID=2590015 RepID=UPI00112B35B2|nr:carbohydrate porin [Shewanella sp. SNU WT4]QDF67380.1 carbohydrate porin [Shewanella sp. SNU WT4]
MNKQLSLLSIAIGLAFSSACVSANQIEKNAADIAALQQQLNTVADDIQFHGYMRAGFAVNENGSSAGNAPIKAAHTDGFYRLGGSESNYAAWNLSKGFTSESGAWARAYIGYVYEDRDARRWPFDGQGEANFMEKAYVEMGNLDFAPEAIFWGGRVNFSRDIHMLDLKLYEIRSPGVGVRGLNLGEGKFDAFVVAHEADNDTKYTTSDGTTIQYQDGARPEILTLGTEYTIGNWWLTASVQSNSTPVTFQVTDTFGTKHKSTAAETGVSAMIHYTQPSFFGLGEGQTKYAVQYAQGTSAAMLGRIGDTNLSNKDGQNYRASIDGRIQFENWEVNTVVLAQHKQDQLFDGHENTWYSVGARPAYYVTENFAMQFEAGYNWSDFSNGVQSTSGGLATFTIAPTLKLKSMMSARPEIRLFATFAKATGDYNVGNIGGYNDQQHDAFIFGAQVETWF